eukprot:gene23660-28669_t
MATPCNRIWDDARATYQDPTMQPTALAIAEALAGISDDESEPMKDCLAEFDPVERHTRLELAAAYRWIAKMGWSDTINNHISAKIPGTEHFLLN